MDTPRMRILTFIHRVPLIGRIRAALLECGEVDETAVTTTQVECKCREGAIDLVVVNVCVLSRHSITLGLIADILAMEGDKPAVLATASACPEMEHQVRALGASWLPNIYDASVEEIVAAVNSAVASRT